MLTSELAAEVAAAVQSGEYYTVSEVVRDALESWKDRRDYREFKRGKDRLAVANPDQE